MAKDKTPTVDVLKYVFDKYKTKNYIFDEIWSLTPCSPLIKAQDLIKSSMLLKKKNKIIISITSYSTPIEWAFYKKNKLIPVNKNLYKKRSQDLSTKYHDAGNFVGIPVSFFKKRIDFDKNYIGYELPRSRAVDIDNLKILSLLKYFMKNKFLLKKIKLF